MFVGWRVDGGWVPERGKVPVCGNWVGPSTQSRGWSPVTAEPLAQEGPVPGGPSHTGRGVAGPRGLVAWEEGWGRSEASPE